MKTCTICRETKPFDGFFKRARAPSGHESMCKVCRKQKNAAWFSANKDRHHEMTRKWYAENKDYHLKKTKERYLTDPAAALAKYYLRDERTKLATPSWADRSAIASMYRKARSITKQTGIRHEVDHVIPLRGKSVSGLHVHSNMQVIPATENRRKLNSFSI